MSPATGGNWHKVAEVDDLPEGRVKTVSAKVDRAPVLALAHDGPALVEVMTDVELI